MTERELFKEAVMQYMVDDTRVQRVSKRRKKHPVARRILFVAAGLIVAFSVTVFSIPSARAAVEELISSWFSPREYFGQEKSERTKEPTIEAITTTAGENKVTISNVGEEFKAYADAFDMKLEEVAYDGEQIYLSGTMSGATARPFVEAFTGGDTFWCSEMVNPLSDDPYTKYDISSCENNFSLETTNGTYIGCLEVNLTDEMNTILVAATETIPEPVFQDGKLMTTNTTADALWDQYLKNHEVRFSVELTKVLIEMQPLTGMVNGDVTLKLYYANEDGAVFTQVLDADFGTITIDANAYLAETKTTQAKTENKVELGGIHPVTIHEWQPEAERTGDTVETYHYTHELDFTGASFSLKEISFTPTDTKITLHVVLPKSWTAAERCYCNLSFQCLMDGDDMGFESYIPFSAYGPIGTADETGKTREYDFNLFESSLSPSQWAEVKTLTIIPVTTYAWNMKVSVDDGPAQDISLRNGAIYTGIVNHTRYNFDSQFDVMTQYALTVNLDDYR